MSRAEVPVDAQSSVVATAGTIEEEEESDDEILNDPDKFRDESLATLPAVRVRRNNNNLPFWHSRLDQIDETRTHLQEAIEHAKQCVLDCDGTLLERSDLVQSLIRLRIQEYVMIERTTGPLPDFEKRGHVLVDWESGKGNIPGANAKKIYCQVWRKLKKLYMQFQCFSTLPSTCQVCASKIWVYLQSTALYCLDCGYAVHGKFVLNLASLVSLTP